MTRNILFKIFFFSGIASICILFLPALVLPQKITLMGGKIMGQWTKFCLKIFLSVNKQDAKIASEEFLEPLILT